MTEYDTKEYNINNCSTIFRLPIDYLDNKSILEKNIHSDLELIEQKIILTIVYMIMYLNLKIHLVKLQLNYGVNILQQMLIF